MGVDSTSRAPPGSSSSLPDGVRHAARRYIAKGASWESTKLDAANVQQLRVSKDGKTLVFLQSTAASPPRWSRAALDGAVLQVGKRHFRRLRVS